VGQEIKTCAYRLLSGMCHMIHHMHNSNLQTHCSALFPHSISSGSCPLVSSVIGAIIFVRSGMYLLRKFIIPN